MNDEEDICKILKGKDKDDAGIVQFAYATPSEEEEVEAMEEFMAEEPTRSYWPVTDQFVEDDVSAYDAVPQVVDTEPMTLESEEIFDPVHHVKHYQLTKDLEVRHVIQLALKHNGLSGPDAHYFCNALKYMLRLGRKGDKVEDLHKAQTYLKFLDTNFKENNNG